MKTTRKIEIKATGNQAPYGIGEIMAVMPTRHWRKIHSYVTGYHSRPKMYCVDCGEQVSFSECEITHKPDGIMACNCK